MDGKKHSHRGTCKISKYSELHGKTFGYQGAPSTLSTGAQQAVAITRASSFLAPLRLGNTVDTIILVLSYLLSHGLSL